MFTSIEFKSLELMSESEVLDSIDEAKEEATRISDLIASNIGQAELNLYLDMLKNTENYIRKAENMLFCWDDNRSINKARKNYATFNDLVPIKPLKIKLSTR